MRTGLWIGLRRAHWAAQSVALGAALLGCGKGGAPAREAPAASEPAAEEPASDEVEGGSDEGGTVVASMPTHFSCDHGKECLPPVPFALATCKGSYPGLAIHMFEKSTPWTRLFIKSDRLEPVNTHGAKTTEALVLGEEVILLRRHGSGSDGMTVSGSDVDLLRWDGSCVTLPGEHLAEQAPTGVKNAPIKWRYLDEVTSEALLQVEQVKLSEAKQSKSCHGAAKASKGCENAQRALNTAITTAVRGGLELSEPALLPEWNIQ